MATSVTLSIDDTTGIARITLDAAAAGNPINTESLAEFRDAVLAATRSSARVIVLRSTGRFFTVGGDLGAFHGAEDPAAYIDELADVLHRVVSELQRSEAIVVTAVQGVAAGAGFPLAAAGDIVLAGRSASFTLAYTKVGLSPDGGSSLLVHSLGLHRALRYALLNDVLSAEDAQQAGLVARVVEDDELEAETEKIAERLAAGPRVAQASAKRLLRHAVEDAPESRLREEALAIRVQADGPESREGIAAFLSKRAADFRGIEE